MILNTGISSMNVKRVSSRTTALSSRGTGALAVRRFRSIIQHSRLRILPGGTCRQSSPLTMIATAPDAPTAAQPASA